MKITRISVEFMVDENIAVEEFMARLLSTATPVTIEHTPNPTMPAAGSQAAPAIIASVPVSDTVADTGTSRRRRTGTHGSKELDADAAKLEAMGQDPGPTMPVADTGSRRRRAAPPAASPDPMPINDAEMSKAASNACEVLVNMGEDGPGIVKLILEEMGAASAGDVPQDKRQQFLDECAKEIRLAKEEKEMAP